MDPAAPTYEPTRRNLEQLLARLSHAYLESLNPLERAIAMGLVRSKGWDLARLASGSGPLAALPERSLAILVSAFALELAAVAPDVTYTLADLDAAMGELKAAMA